MANWADANNVKTILFEPYDEPWKGPADGSSGEAFFAIWNADGPASDRSHYTLTGASQEYNLSQPACRRS